MKRNLTGSIRNVNAVSTYEFLRGTIILIFFTRYFVRLIKVLKKIAEKDIESYLIKAYKLLWKFKNVENFGFVI